MPESAHSKRNRRQRLKDAGLCFRCGAETQETANVQQPRHYAFFCADCQIEVIENA